MNPALEHAFDLEVELAAAHELGACAGGTRRIVPIIGGKASGPLLNGTILALGADWQTVGAQGVAELDARYAIQTARGAVIGLEGRGIRHASAQVAARIAAGEAVPPADYYMRSFIRLECGHPAYAWVNRSLFVATGGKVGRRVELCVYRLG